jgi:hypothetical protein
MSPLTLIPSAAAAMAGPGRCGAADAIGLGAEARPVLREGRPLLAGRRSDELRLPRETAAAEDIARWCVRGGSGGREAVPESSDK